VTSLDLGTPEKGCLLLADITGYTDYLAGTELMHAQDVLADLLETIVGTVEPVFRLAKLEGDAAFAYAPTETISPSMVMDTVESAYFSFRRRLRDVTHSTTCECNACMRIPTLDLKFFVHDGEYVTRRIARSEELTGPDVILLHRLAKGSSGKVIGQPAYAVYTAQTMDRMAVNPSVLGFVPHTESFDDIGEVPVFIQDLAARWMFEQERNRDYITSSQAALEVAFETPASPALVWDHLTDPKKRVVWQHGTTGLVKITEDLHGAGTINHCMHGPDVLIEHISDYRPFAYITARYDQQGLPEKLGVTFELKQIEAGTRVEVRMERMDDELLSQVGDSMRENYETSLANLKSMLDEAERPSTAAAEG
jgi:uncharacterized protein YndB with AHSA1/START domain